MAQRLLNRRGLAIEQIGTALGQGLGQGFKGGQFQKVANKMTEAGATPYDVYSKFQAIDPNYADRYLLSALKKKQENEDYNLAQIMAVDAGFSPEEAKKFKSKTDVAVAMDVKLAKKKIDDKEKGDVQKEALGNFLTAVQGRSALQQLQGALPFSQSGPTPRSAVPIEQTQQAGATYQRAGEMIPQMADKARMFGIAGGKSPEEIDYAMGKTTPAKPIKDPDKIRVFETATTFSEAGRGTPEYQTAFENFYRTGSGGKTKGEIAADRRKEFEGLKDVKDSIDVLSKYNAMLAVWDGVVNASQSGNKKRMLAADQALVTSFNKMTDPGSVVRESEYARTAEGAAVIDRMRGKVTKLATGGTGLTSEDRQEIMVVSEQLATPYRSNLNTRKQQYENILKQEGIDPTVFFDVARGLLKHVSPRQLNQPPADDIGWRGAGQYDFGNGFVEVYTKEDYAKQVKGTD